MVDLTNPEEIKRVHKLLIKPEHYKMRLMINLWSELYHYRPAMGAIVPTTAVEHSIEATKYLEAYKNILNDEEKEALIYLSMPDCFDDKKND
jgi:hypothetical protein